MRGGGNCAQPPLHLAVELAETALGVIQTVCPESQPVRDPRPMLFDGLLIEHQRRLRAAAAAGSSQPLICRTPFPGFCWRNPSNALQYKSLRLSGGGIF
jgi:hypothetical protein